MKIKQTIVLFIISLLPMSAALTTLTPDMASALTDSEIRVCADQWGGRSTDPADEQQLSDKDVSDFNASKCSNGSDPACKLEKIRRSNWKLIVCQEVGDGEAATPGVDVVASNITNDNYKEYTDSKIEKECKRVFSNSGKQKKCIALAKQKHDTIAETMDTGGGGGGGVVDGCAGIETAIIKCSQDNSGGTENNGVWGLLLMVINIMTAGVGILAVGGIVYGAILYTTAQDQAAQVKKATDIITNVVFGLVAYALMWAGLNFLVPGGVFS